MKNDLKKLALLLLFGAVALGGCAIENRGHRRYDRDDHGRYDRGRDRNHYNDHHYNNY
ncbi:hypothetical protein [Mucilaginibacter glaciei]|uniref:Lipoprotein n=1 Tax=Mucilaginibacter glaciei TaxID=2772109 RepID=A0A926S328_9SPHI|nr:hypothetical protein [Mucilaginibacter glaciei]MBD1394497.1 hypothetical protein [Mucilaginibacter glaciei]